MMTFTSFKQVLVLGGLALSLLAAGSDAQKRALLPRLAAGNARRRAIAARRAGSMVRMAGAVGDMSELRAPFAAAHKEAEQRLESMVLRGQAEGVIRPGLDADAAALMVGSLLLGVSTQLLIDPGMDLEPIRRTSLATLRASSTNSCMLMTSSS